MRLDTRAFTSKVARRAFVLFVACALLPVSALAILSFQKVTSELHEQSERRLRQASKAVALGLYKRLLTLEASMGTTADRPDEHLDDGLPRPFTAMALFTDDGRSVPLSGRMDHRPVLTAEARRHLASGRTLLSTERSPTGPPRVFLSRVLDRRRPDQGILHGEVNARHLWAFEDEPALPPTTRLMVLDDSGAPLFSSFGSSTPVPTQVVRGTHRGTAGQFMWSDDADEYTASYWSLFLQYRFLKPKWTIVLNEAMADVLAPMADFGRTFFLVILLSVWIVLLLSMRQIRKQLTPLERLREGTHRIAMGDFASGVDVRSGDEFEELATSFNQMASQLGKHFTALSLRSEITAALSRSRRLEEILQECAEILMRHLGLTAAQVWTLGGDGTTLELRASAGAPAHPDGEQRQIRVGQSAIGLIAEERRPYVTNSLLGDPRLRDTEWARGEGSVAFVGHPLLVENRLVGVVAASATRPLDVMDLGGFASAAGELARCIERKRVDEALHGTEEQVRQLQKMEAVGRLAGGIAHDFNNLLTIITGRSRLLLANLTPGEPVHRGLTIIDETAQRAALLTRQLLAFSRRQVLAPTVVDLNEVVPGMTEILCPLIGEDIELVFMPCGEPARVTVDRGQIEQVIVNLVVNARDAMPDGGRITIETSSLVFGEPEASRHIGVSPGPHVMLAVRDTGIGMDSDTQSRIFEPFFTTKGPGQGTGLGLATVYGIVRQSGGSIGVESAPRAGTTFTIHFPRAEGAAETVETTSPPPARGSETVLLVEDENEVRALAHQILEGHGYIVLSAGRGADALRIAERHAGPIHLLVTDMVMPEMSGTALAERLVALHPEMAVLYMSGYTDYAPVGYGRAGPEIHFLQKPFTPDALARKIRAVLDAALRDPVA